MISRCISIRSFQEPLFNTARMRNFTVVLLVLLALESLHPQNLSLEEKEILMLQDQRSMGGGKLISYLKHQQSSLRAKACIALANIQDTSALADVVPLLEDTNDGVRSSAAFALGLIGSGRSQASLFEALRKEPNDSVAGRMMEALGRCGDQEGLDGVIEFSSLKNSLKQFQALSVARFALRNIKSERSIWFCFDLLADLDPEVQWRALYALWRSLPHGLIDIEISKRKETLIALAKSSNADVRIHLATLIGRSKSADAGDIFAAIEESEQQFHDWRVEVQIVRGYGSLIPRHPELLEHLLTALTSQNDHVLIAALQTVAQLPRLTEINPEVRVLWRERLKELARPKKTGAILVQGEALVALARQFPEDDFELFSTLGRMELSPVVRAKCLEALSHNPSAKTLEVFLEKLTDDSLRVSMAAWDFIKRFFTPRVKDVLRSKYENWENVPQRVFEKVITALKRDDVAITSLVAGALADSSFFALLDRSDRKEAIEKGLKESFDRLVFPEGVEARQAIVRALGSINAARSVPFLEKALNDPVKTVAMEAAKALQQITGRDYSNKVAKASRLDHVDFDWPSFESINENQKLLLKTEKGIVTLVLLKTHAPFTVLNFVKLVRRKFFDGLTFHRVVPNFVVQGGDPRGDGWGGPGYTMRSEYGLMNYERGSVGVASAGKDTEGCQFFITHTAQPHLDGRYTIFARVVSGMDVVDRLQVGDRILGMEVTN